MQDDVPYDGTKDGASSAIDKALDVLFELHMAPQGFGVSELARRMELPKSSVHRLLATLVRRGVAERDGDGRYHTGMALVALGRAVLAREPLIRAARPILESTAATLGETAFLVAARGQRLVVLDRVEGNGVLRASPTIGTEVPVHATAVGKLQLAYAPEDVRPIKAHSKLVAFTAHTRDERALHHEVVEARARGWAESHEEWQVGLSVLAAPIRARPAAADAPGLLGTLAVAVATARLPTLGRATLAQAMVDAAKAVEGQLGGDTAPRKGRST